MAYCNNCGNKLKKDDAFCTKCGNKIESEVPVVQTTYVKPKSDNFLGITGFVMSLIGLLTCGTFTIPGIILSIMGYVMRDDYNPDRKGLSLAGIIISIITLVLLVLLMIFPFILIGIFSIFGLQEVNSNLPSMWW